MTVCGVYAGPAHVPAGPALDAIAHRGPDARGEYVAGGWRLGHVRLAVLDIDRRSDQPFVKGPVALSYNGELWNYKAVRAGLEVAGAAFGTAGDTEVFAAALESGTDAPGSLAGLEGMFAAAWVDGSGVLHAARDRFGEIPLHWGFRPDGWPVVCSELKGLLAAGVIPSTVQWVQPGTVLRFGSRHAQPVAIRWYSLSVRPRACTIEESSRRVVSELAAACRERAISDVPVAVLMSGGIDSTAVAALLREHVPGLVGYTVVHDPYSLDLRTARLAASWLGIPLREVPVPSPTADDFSRTVRVIEMSSKAQVEIGWACLHLAARLKADGFKVVFSGEGSDELWASYGNSYHGITRDGWYGHRLKAFTGQHRKNFPRCNKIFLAHGVESRLPFLHTRLVEWGLSLPMDAVFRINRGPRGQLVKGMGAAKWHMRAGFRGLLPDEVCGRDKVAFQSGAGLIESAARAVADPARFYRAEFATAFRGIKS